MELFNKIWMALTTENESLTILLALPAILIEATISMLLFSTILNIKYTKKQQLIYISFASILGFLCSFIIPKPFGNIITLIAMPIAIMLIFKATLLKAILAEFIPVVLITILEIVINKLLFILFKIDYSNLAFVPLIRFGSIYFIYLILFLIYKLVKHTNFYISISNIFYKKNKLIILTSMSIALIILFMQFYLIIFYNNTLPLFIVLLNIVFLIAYFSITMISMIKTMKLEKTQIDLEQEKLSNKTLQILHDNTRAFKHDFSNILAGIGGYIETNDMNGLKKYYNQLINDCNHIKNCESLNPNVINSPPVYAVLANKYYTADSKGIKINLESFIDFNQLYMDIYEFTRILGILMDNAIEAAGECKNKLINITIRNDKRQNRQLFIIENTYKDKNLNIEKLSQKGFTSKPNNTGLGLWEIEKILKKHKNIAKFTTKNNDFFIQQIEIYNE